MSSDVRRAWLRLLPGWLRPGQGALPILMYHKVKPLPLDLWTVSVAELDRQFAYLNRAGYRAISCAELASYMNRQAALPEKPVLITFDDGYADNLTHAYPLLARHGLRATMFLPVRFIGGENDWDGGGERLLDYDQLRTMSPQVIEFGLHSFGHGNYRRMSLTEIEADLRQSIAELEARGLPFVAALAYPYGRDPARRCCRRRSMHALLASLGIQCGLRIGNRVNRLPIGNRYGLTRIDIRSADTLETFCRKLER
jgi:peptidoglycan/xylan/chitin deacetylase (PgdA/CDA1 family)